MIHSTHKLRADPIRPDVFYCALCGMTNKHVTLGLDSPCPSHLARPQLILDETGPLRVLIDAKRGQSRRMSALEAFAGRAINFSVLVPANYLVLPLFGFPVSAGESIALTIIFMSISICTSYSVRRFFNRLHLNLKEISHVS